MREGYGAQGGRVGGGGGEGWSEGCGASVRTAMIVSEE